MVLSTTEYRSQNRQHSEVDTYPNRAIALIRCRRFWILHRRNTDYLVLYNWQEQEMIIVDQKNEDPQDASVVNPFLLSSFQSRHLYRQKFKMSVHGVIIIHENRARSLVIISPTSSRINLLPAQTALQ